MEKIKGSCEHCGKDYEMTVDTKQDVICPHCGKVTQNWDSPEVVDALLKVEEEIIKDKNQIVYDDEGLYIRQGTGFRDGKRIKWDYQTVILDEKAVTKLKKILCKTIKH